MLLEPTRLFERNACLGDEPTHFFKVEGGHHVPPSECVVVRLAHLFLSYPEVGNRGEQYDCYVRAREVRSPQQLVVDRVLLQGAVRVRGTLRRPAGASLPCSGQRFGVFRRVSKRHAIAVDHRFRVDGGDARGGGDDTGEVQRVDGGDAD
jgi:hypothetical protein